MACGCGGSSNSGAASGPLLSGALDGGYAGGYAGDAPPDDSQIAAADDAGQTIKRQFRSGGFWFLVVVLVVGAAWYLDSKKSGDS